MADYRATFVIPGPAPCAAVTTVVQQPWLLREAPRLPLPYCTRSEDCACRYQKIPDRRQTAIDRRILAERKLVAAGVWQSDERRRSPGRRASDFAAAR